MNCPIKGHDHLLACIAEHVQDGTGNRAETWECPTGRYRWFVLAGRSAENSIRLIRPRWGWKPLTHLRKGN
jgi:hypothetical protein